MLEEQMKWLEGAFAGHSTESQSTEYSFYVKQLGLLRIDSGEIVACDPVTNTDDTPIHAKFPLGQFPVELAVLQIADDEETEEAEEAPDERVAFARIVFAQKPVAVWKMAHWDALGADELQGDEYVGYAVDAGTGAFMDRLAFQKLNERLLNDEEEFDRIWDELDASYQDTRSWLLKDLGDGLNMAAFSSGYGDGVYPVYIGYDAAGAVVRLTTDFGCLWDFDEDEEDDDEEDDDESVD